MKVLNNIKILLALFAVIAVSGCANLPPIIQDHGGDYGVYLPTGKELMTAMLYRQDAKFSIPGGKTCILEHNTLNGHVRFLYPNSSFNQMHGWRDIRYAGSRTLPDGQVMGLFLGTVNGQPDTEEMVLFHPFGISFLQLGTRGVAYAPVRITAKHILFRQVQAKDPLLRVFNIPQQQATMPVLQSVVLEQEAEIRQKDLQAAALRRDEARKSKQRILRERRLREQERAPVSRRVSVPQSDVRRNHAQMAVQIISIQGGTVPVQSGVPMGHQDVMPQTVDLQ